jgi:uncharacterized Ntn-hydrolase superfamily protein
VTFTIVAFDERSGAIGLASGGSHDLPTYRFVGGSGLGGLLASHGAPPLDIGAEELDELARGTDPRDALGAMLQREGVRVGRQILIVDRRGRTAAHSGRGGRRLFAHTEGTDHVAAGDNLPSPNVVGAMSLSFERSGGDPLWERLLLALESGARAGGDREGTRAALLLVCTDAAATPSIDVRVEDHEDPIAELRRLLAGFMSS